jgi:hypothetical protein
VWVKNFLEGHFEMFDIGGSTTTGLPLILPEGKINVGAVDIKDNLRVRVAEARAFLRVCGAEISFVIGCNRGREVVGRSLGAAGSKERAPAPALDLPDFVSVDKYGE